MQTIEEESIPPLSSASTGAWERSPLPHGFTEDRFGSALRIRGRRGNEILLLESKVPVLPHDSHRRSEQNVGSTEERSEYQRTVSGALLENATTNRRGILP